ncbi:MAG: ABC transporter ATP-binding protein [Actinomycetia bacterium]|nr:ABC transporter ATP-binding protein [Actinomycetes bacterium]
MGSAVTIDGVSKRFKLHHERVQSLKEKLIRSGRNQSEDFWALRDIDLEIATGETVGLLGHNGSGKSTLLKIAGGILRPTTGSVTMNGRVASLLELGAGFHPDLSGRENVYLNASILGISKRDIDLRFDDIVSFAELEQFIDTPVKTYSSGMYVRLGFAVAVNVEPDILLVDEVLAVGDETFQRKCLDRVRQFQTDGRTIVIVSHSAEQIRQVCTRAVVLDHGLIVSDAEPGESIRVYREHLFAGQLERAESELADAAPEPEAPVDDAPTPVVDVQASEVSHGEAQEAKSNKRVRITGMRFEYEGADTRRYLLPSDPLRVVVEFEADQATADVVFGIGIHDRDGNALFGANTDTEQVTIDLDEGSGEFVFDFASVPLLDGTYPITVGIHSHDEGTVYDWSEQRHWFEVMNPGRSVGKVHLPVTMRVDPS